MKRQITAIALGVILSGNAMAGDGMSKEEKKNAIGFGSGLVAGAVVGGPLGAVVGGIFGVLISEDMNHDQYEKQTEKTLQANRAEMARRDQQLVALQQELQQTRESSQRQLVAVQQHVEQLPSELQSNIQFRTASSQIENHYLDQLDLLAEQLLANPQLSVSLLGFADQRGEDQYNLSLSEKRVDAVKAYLLDKGVNEAQLQAQALGESQIVSNGQGWESDFFDRRVVVKIAPQSEAMTASTQND